MKAISPFRSQESAHVFVSHRGSRRELAMRLSDAARSAGLISDTIEEDLGCPFPPGSADEFGWLTERIAGRIHPGSTFIMMASKDAGESRWVLWEGLEGFTKAYRVIICWLSGADPLKTVFPLPRFAYRFTRVPQSFIVDARRSPDIAVAAVSRILDPPHRYRVLLRLQQALTVLVCAAMVLLPATVLLAASLLPAAAAEGLRSALLRPWVCLLSAALAALVGPVFYPSYGGPSRLAPDPVDARIRLVTPGFTGWNWHSGIIALSFVLACTIDGIALGSLASMSAIGWETYFKAFLIGVVPLLLYGRISINVFTNHLGIVLRKMERYYDSDDAPGPARAAASASDGG